MTKAHIRATAKQLKVDVRIKRTVVWQWKRWEKWTRDEIETLAEIADVCFASDGDYCDLRFFEWM